MPALALKPSTVLRFPGGIRTRLDSPLAIQLVQQEVRLSRRTYWQIAEAAGISTSTVAKIAYGETKRPSFNTIFAILQSLGWTIYAEK